MRKIFLIFSLFFSTGLLAQVTKAPEIKEGDGPYTQLIIRGVMLIDGTGAPPVGPVDIVVKQNRIVNIASIANRPKLEAGGKELNCEGMYLMPGFVDMHGHIGGNQAPIAEYGITFIFWGVTVIKRIIFQV